MKISLKLHALMKEISGEPDASYKIEKNKDGIITASKNSRLVHSKYHITNECKRALENINKNKNLLIMYGYGLGYILKYLMENIDNYFNKNTIKTLKIIAVVEDTVLFKYSYYNIYNPDSENIFFIHKDDSINYINELIDYKSINGVNLVILPSLTKEEKDNANTLYTQILNIMEKEVSNIFTNMYFENIWTKNIIFNSEYIKDSADLSIFKDSFKGLKALLICPGPTLKHSIQYIKENRENLFIICVDTSYSVLCKHGIIPDFVITVDGGFFNSLDFVYENSHFPYLVMDMSCNKIIPKNTCCKTNLIRFTSIENLGLIEYIQDFTKLSSLKASNTVATAMIDFAYYIGLDEVLLIGFDNSYPFYERHIKHALSYEYMVNKTNKLKTYESYYFNAIKNNTNIDNYPPTEFVFESQIEYFNEFKNKYKKMKIKRITKEAVKIESIEEGNINNFSENNLRQKALNIANNIYKKDNNENIKKAYEKLKNTLEEFRNILTNTYNNINLENIDSIYDETINTIKEYQNKASILKTILSTTIIMCERGEREKKEKLIFLLMESLRNVNYFFTRISLIINKLG